jgi:N-acetylglucosamine-6-sulfatase
MIVRLLAALIFLGSVLDPVLSAWEFPTAAASSPPNIVTILVDDLDAASVAEMPAVNELLVPAGMSFTQFFSPTPLCCPARVSLLRGQYAHNHTVLRNTGESAGFAQFLASGGESDTVATQLQAAGYTTALIGKYLNGYVGADNPKVPVPQTYVPPGWDTWVSGINHAAYSSFDYTLNVNGDLIEHGHDDADYITDVLAGYAIDFLDDAASKDEPFFLYLAPYAPHSPANPAPRHAGMFTGAQAPRSPAFNEEDVSDKPAWIQAGGAISVRKQQKLDENYQHRLESLQAVDEMVREVVDTLDAHGRLESTYILFLSDNGFFLGEHRQPSGKDAPYDSATRVPLIIRGPGIAPGTQTDGLALITDLFPTFADLAGIEPPAFVDGRSLAPLWQEADPQWRQNVLFEGFGREFESEEKAGKEAPAFKAFRTADLLYTEYETGEREVYDLRTDPFELDNIIDTVSADDSRVYADHLAALAGCAADTCRALEDTPVPTNAP